MKEIYKAVNEAAGREDLGFSDIKEPRVLCLIALNGGGSKLFQSYLDAHPEVYNIPAYPMLYFYPHWETWEEQYQDVWNWDTIINIFCIKHASVIDSRNIVGINGLDMLGEGRDEYAAIDSGEFRRHLRRLLRDEPVRRRTFLLAINYAYALCRDEDIARKKVLLWHHHVVYHLDDFVNDFPDAHILGMIRDPRIKMYRAYKQFMNVDRIKLNTTDAIINRSYAFYHANRYMLTSQYLLQEFAEPGRVLFLKHEDLASNLPGVMRKTADLLQVQFLDLMLESTFDGKIWWGHEVYRMPKAEERIASQRERANKISRDALNEVLSTAWKDDKPAREIFIFEGITFDFLMKYGYTPFYYRKDSLRERLLLCAAILLPFHTELEDAMFHLNPRTHADIVLTAWKEATGRIKRKYYGFNGTYLYKYTYKAFKLWKRPKIVRWLDRAEKLKNKDAVSHRIFMAAAVLYVLYVYIRFLAAIAFLPVQYFRRIGMYYITFFKRLSHGSFLAPLL